jgi:hypothetical protein
MSTTVQLEEQHITSANFFKVSFKERGRDVEPRLDDRLFRLPRLVRCGSSWTGGSTGRTCFGWKLAALYLALHWSWMLTERALGPVASVGRRSVIFASAAQLSFARAI